MTNSSGSRSRLTYATESSFGVIGTAGWHDVTFDATLTTGTSTGLTNDTTVYHFQVDVDGGGDEDVYIIGLQAQTFGALINAMNQELDGATASLEAETNEVRITSNTVGTSSSVIITDDDLFSSLNDFDTVESPGVLGTGSPSFAIIPHITNTFENVKSAFEDPTQDSSRNVRFYRHGNKAPTGQFTSAIRYGALDDMLAAVLGNSWTGDTLTNGTTLPSFAFESGRLDTSTYTLTKGCRVGSVTLDVPQDDIVRATWNILAREVTRDTSEIAAPSTPPANSNKPMVHHEGSLLYDGASLAIITGFSLTIDNGIQHDPVLFNSLPGDITPGKFRVSGNITAYFADNSIADDWDNETEVSLAFTLSDPAGNDITFTMPVVKLSNFSDPQTDDRTITQTANFMAFNPSGATLTITRSAA